MTLAPDNLWANHGLVDTLIEIGDPESALKIAETQGDDGFRLENQAIAHHMLGNFAESEAALDELITEHSRLYAINIGRVLARKGDVDGAFEWLQKSVEYKDNGVPTISWDQKFEVLHDDPRWLQLLESIGRSPEQLAAVQFDTVMPR